MRKNLIFCAMGPGPGTVPFARERSERGVDHRNWDLVEVLWQPAMIAADQDRTYRTIAEQVLYERDRTKRKFACFADHFPAGSCDYDAVMIADDDLTPVNCAWSDVFDLFHESGLEVAQAALTRDSTRVWSWPVTHVDPSHVPGLMTVEEVQAKGRTQYRTTDFVEVMAPIFTRAAVEKGLRYFLDEPYGLGLETWWHLEFASKGKLGVLDATPMRHTRPVGSAHSMSGIGSGLHPFEIAEAFRQRHGFPTVFRDDTCWTLARWGKDSRGRRIQLPSLPSLPLTPLALSSLPAGEARPA